MNARALTTLLLILLIDAGIETFLHGSPVRWWVAAGAIAIVGVNGAAWRRTSPRTKAWTAGLGLLAVLAVTAWLPRGTIDGVRMVGLDTGRVLAITTAAAIAVAGAPLTRLQRIPRGMKWAIGGLTAYGTIAFLQGARSGAPFSALLAGHSLWRALPFILQGAVVGGVLILPLGLVHAAVTGGLRPPAEGSAAHSLRRALALALSFTTVLAALPQRSAAPSQQATNWAQSPPAGIASLPERLTMLENSFRAIEDGARESPRDRWDSSYVVEQLGSDPQQLFEWVRDNTYWIPYHGALRGPAGVLMDRQGNSLDRALLLGTLMQKAGHRVRLVHAELGRERTRTLLPRLAEIRALRGTDPMVEAEDPTGSIRAVAAQYMLDGGSIEASLDARTARFERALSDLDQRVANQTRRLTAMLSATRAPTREWDTRLAAADDALRDHWWVQRADGDAWIDFDLLGRSGESRDALGTVRDVRELADALASLSHEIAIRVVTERWSNGTVEERTAVSHSVRTADLIGTPILLRFWPAAWPGRAAGDTFALHEEIRRSALEERAWTVTLMAGREIAAQAVIRDSGDVEEPKAANPFGGLGGAIAGAFGSTTSTTPRSTLTGAWIEYELLAPRAAPRVIRRTVFDLLGSNARTSVPVPEARLDDAARLSRSLSLTMETDVLPVTSAIAPEFAIHLMTSDLIANRDLVRAILRDLPADSAPEEIAGRISSMPHALYALAVTSRDSSQSARVLIDRPQILTRHVGLRATDVGISRRDAIDIVANEVGVDLIEPDAFAARLEQGVRDTNAEALVQVGPVVANTAQAFAASDAWVVLRSADDPQLTRLRFPEPIKRTIVSELADGFVVVVPEAPVEPHGFVGWWRVNPRTGDTLGVDRMGWGLSAVERAILLNAARTAFYDFAFCEALHEFVAEARDGAASIVEVFQGGTGFGTGARSGIKVCAIAGILAGALATLPLFWLRLRRARAALLSPPPGTLPPGPPHGPPLRGPSPPRGSPRPGWPPRGSLPPPGRNPAPVAPRSPSKPPITADDFQKARSAVDHAIAESNQADRKFWDYRQKGDLYKDPTWNALEDQRLLEHADRAQQRAHNAIGSQRLLERAYQEQRAAGQGLGGPIYGPPAQIRSIPGGLPRGPLVGPNKGVAGTAGISDSFYPLPWE